MTDRTARNYMRAAEWAEGKPETISDLAPTAIYMLASPSTPEPIRERVVADLEAGKTIDMNEVMARIKMARSERRIDRSEDLKKQARNRKRSAKYRHQREQEKTEHEARQKRVDEAVQETCSILFKLDTTDLDRLVELLDIIEKGWPRGDLPKALRHARGITQ